MLAAPGPRPAPRRVAGLPRPSRDAPPLAPGGPRPAQAGRVRQTSRSGPATAPRRTSPIWWVRSGQGEPQVGIPPHSWSAPEAGARRLGERPSGCFYAVSGSRRPQSGQGQGRVGADERLLVPQGAGKGLHRRPAHPLAPARAGRRAPGAGGGRAPRLIAAGAADSRARASAGRGAARIGYRAEARVIPVRREHAAPAPGGADGRTSCLLQVAGDLGTEVEGLDSGRACGALRPHDCGGAAALRDLREGRG